MKKNSLKTLGLISCLAFHAFITNSCGTEGSVSTLTGEGDVTVNVDDGDVSFDQNFLATFSVPIDINTVTTSSFFIVPDPDVTGDVTAFAARVDSTVCNPELAISATVSCASTTSCELIPTFHLDTGTDYHLCLTSEIQFLQPDVHGVFQGYDVGFTTNDAVLQSLSVSPSTVSMDVEDTQQFTVTGTFDDNTTQTITDNLVWSSSHENFVTVTQNGLATALALGEAEITVMQSTTELSATATASVDFPVGGAFRYTVGGTTSGLTDTLVLQVNGADDLTQIADGDFTFDTTIRDGETYEVTVLTQPLGQTCTVTNGSGTMGGANVTTVAVTCVSNDTTLSVSVSTLALSVNNTGLNTALTGTPRLITITNTGVVAASDVTYSPSPALPSGTTISPASCGAIAAFDACVLTITPGATPSAASGDTSPTPITLSISGANTNTLTPTVTVVTYGSVYQGGYVYAVDDTTPNTGSIGGKVAALTDQSAGLIWSSDGSGAVSYVAILGIDDLSTPLSPSPTSPSYPPGTPTYVACNGNSDGACNTSNIVSYYNFNRASGGPAPTPLDQYAAALCTATISGERDWYLPAICEEGYDEIGGGANGCGTQASPTIQNMLSNLFDAGVGGLSGEYWSSTEWSGDATLYAWSQTFDIGNILQNTFDKSYNTIRVRCSRALTP